MHDHNGTKMQKFLNRSKSSQGYARANNGGQNRAGGGNRPHASAGPASAKRNYERYLALARAATLAGDELEAENCYQHADHYFRVLREG